MVLTFLIHRCVYQLCVLAPAVAQGSYRSLVEWLCCCAYNRLKTKTIAIIIDAIATNLRVKYACKLKTLRRCTVPT